uniref:Cytochrome b5 heme-binding domain-containing protein n=1 Tax=Tetradesmus obliquus TaxID=3088 RepID=A0A383V6X5_TETOB|eukprot:jgi/Sobl393_1/13618/SZX60334.1
MSSELRSRRKAADAHDRQPDAAAADADASQGPAAQKAAAASSSSAGLAVFLLVSVLAAAAVGAHRLQLIDLRQVQQQLLAPLQAHLPPALLEKLSPHPTGVGSSSSDSQTISSSSSSSSGSGEQLFTKEELALYTGDPPPAKQQIYIAILGQVFDVSKAPQFYSAGEGYGHFAGTDGSKSFITGDFVGDITDDVSDLDPEACLGLLGWLDFYHKTYTYKGKLIGRFYDAAGAATAALDSVHARAKEGEALKAAREAEEANWPSCNSKWTADEGGSVWCDDGMYPRKLFMEMKGGRAVWRCACFKELGWSDVRKVYVDCDPDAHFCKTNPEAEAADEERNVPAELEAMFAS